MMETIHFADVHIRLANKKARHYTDNWLSPELSCSSCVKDCPSPERLGGILYG
jgi:hypothetical protein